MRARFAPAALVAVCLLHAGLADAENEEALTIRVVDVGAGLCCVARIPPADAADRWHTVVYDAGNFQDQGSSALDGVRSMLAAGSKVDLMVLSHSDSDHLGGVAKICAEYEVEKIIHSGYPRTTGTYTGAMTAIAAEKEAGCEEVDLGKTPVPAGASWRIGAAAVTFVSGFHEPPLSWGIDAEDEEAEYRNAGSIVVRIWYRGRSVLLCGDAVGRRIGDPPEACRDSEKWMAENIGFIPIDSDVMVAPHHGADNGSSMRFIEAVSPAWVVFSAGHKFRHPRKAAVDRYLAAGVAADHMLRTDRGDDEGGDEWDAGRVAGTSDPLRDDDVDIVLTRDAEGDGATVTVANRVP